MANRVKPAPRPVRPRTKSSKLETSLRTQIVEGVYPPGARIPTRDQLQRQHRVSVVTVQRALHELTSQRLIEARRRAGTFVVKDPPHLTEFVILFSLAQTPSLSWFDQSMARESPGVAQQRGVRAEVCYGVRPQPDNQPFVQLCRRVQRHGVAGLIFGDSPGDFLRTPLMQTPRIPCVTLGPIGPEEGVPPAVAVDYENWLDKALNHLIARGRRKIGVIGLPSFNLLYDRLMSGLQQRGMTTRPQWMHSPNLLFPAAISNAAHAMMRLPIDERPDGLIIDDDHFVEHATAGLLAAGVQPGESLDVVAHSNFPWPTRQVVPVRRLGFDVRQVLRACFDLLDKQRRDQPVPRVTMVPAVFEDEVAPVPRHA